MASINPIVNTESGKSSTLASDIESIDNNNVSSNCQSNSPPPYKQLDESQNSSHDIDRETRKLVPLVKPTNMVDTRSRLNSNPSKDVPEHRPRLRSNSSTTTNPLGSSAPTATMVKQPSTGTTADRETSRRRNFSLSSIAEKVHDSNGIPLTKELSKFDIWMTIGMLCMFNLVNYMDRFTVIAVADAYLKPEFHLSDDKIGLISSMFIASYMVFSPPAGYIGDRYSRKWLVVAGAVTWMLSVLWGSLITSEHDSNFNWLLASRTLFGIGEACYVCVAPAIIHDLFLDDDVRTQMLILFNMAVPVGSGLGYVVGGWAAERFGSWQWAMRCTLPLGAVVLLVFILFTPEVPHAYAELMAARKAKQAAGSDGTKRARPTTDDVMESHEGLLPNRQNSTAMKQVSLMDTVRAFAKIRTFIYITVGFTAVCFVLGAGTTWLPILFYRAQKIHGMETDNSNALSRNFRFEPCSNYNYNKTLFTKDFCKSEATLAVLTDTDAGQLECKEFYKPNSTNQRWVGTQCYCRCDKESENLSTSVFMKFGALASVSGIVGALAGGYLAIQWKGRGNLRAESDVCAIGLLFGSIFLYITTVIVGNNGTMAVSWAIYWLGLTCINFNWALVAKITLSIVQPNQKSMANALLNTTGHLLGDAFSAWLIGRIASSIGQIFKDDIDEQVGQSMSVGEPKQTSDEWIEYLQTQQSMLLLPLVCALGAVAFFYASLYIAADSAKVNIKNLEFQQEGSSDSDNNASPAPTSEDDEKLHRR